MSIKWLLQDSGKTVMLQDNFGTVRQMGSNHIGFGLIEGKAEIINLENILTDIDETYIMRGGTKILHLLSSYDDLEQLCPHLTDYQKENKEIFLDKLKKSIFYNSNTFDQYYYSKLDLPLLNRDSKFFPIAENLNTSFETPCFIKPSQDLKTFLPGILAVGQTIENFILNTSHLAQYDHEMALIAPVKEILYEYRFFVVNKQVITGSQYKNHDKVQYDTFIPEHILKAAEQYSQLYQPHDIYTMDLAQTKNSIDIVEYNCWNGSGLYHSDKLKIFKTVESYIEQSLTKKHKNKP